VREGKEDARGETVKVRVKRKESKERGGARGEMIVAINRTGTQPVDSSRVTFARKRGREKEGEREREREATPTSTMLLG